MSESSQQQAKTKTISSRKVYYCEIDDEVTMIFDRVKSTKLKDIYLVVPRQATMFQSLVNIKILKRKIEETSKNLHIITDDQSGVHLCHLAGIPVYERLETRGGYSAKLEDETLKITPLKATINAVEETAPTRLAEKKLTLSELLGRGRRRRIPLLSKAIDIFKGDGEKKDSDMRFVVVSPNRQALFALVTVSILLVLVIFYIALPGSTVSITPKSSVIEHSVNLTFSDYEANKSELDLRSPKVLASHRVLLTIRRVLLQTATGKIFEGQNARGRVSLINTEGKPWPLIPSTRLQTNDGLVFRIGGYVTVPSARGGKNGTLDVEVTADAFDVNGQPIGERGNIGPMSFFLPGLNSENQKKLYGQSTIAFAGGSTIVRKKVSKEDIAAASERLKKELLDSVESELEKKVQEKNTLSTDTSKFALLKGKLAYDISEPRIAVPSDAEGKGVEQFEVSGEVDVSGVYFNLSEVLAIMKTELKIRKNPLKRLAKIDDSSIGYRIFDIDKTHKKFKVTTTIKGIEEFDIIPSKEQGERLIQKIKEHIVGRKVQDAKDYILSLPEVAAVDVKNWPAWAPTIPSITDNITVEIVKSN